MKFHGVIGFAVQSETAPGVWTDSFEEKFYKGDVIRNYSKWQKGENLNDDIEISNQICILGDYYAYQNLSTMKYVEWMGSKWKITGIDVDRPKIKLSIGGIFNE